MDKSFLEKLIAQPEKITQLRYDDISLILMESKSRFQEENLVIEYQPEKEEDLTLVIGDIHGNLTSLMNFIAIIKNENPNKVIFLGDLVDRGARQLECLIVVLCLKILYPKKYILLKGNHETLEMNKAYGFFDDFHYRFGKAGDYGEILSLYQQLPICAIISKKIACIHGGIPEDISLLKELKGLRATDLIQSHDKTLEEGIYQILWNDPKEGLTGFMGSYRGPGIKFFGEDVFEAFLQENELEYAIRGHECYEGLGYKWFFNERLLSIFSSEDYRGDYFPNPAGYALIKNNRIHPKEFTTS